MDETDVPGTVKIGDHAIELLSLNDCSYAVETLRTQILFGYEEAEGAGMDRFAEQHFLQALAHMSAAACSLKLAWMEQLSKR
jgi:hypothetical protein